MQRAFKRKQAKISSVVCMESVSEIRGKMTALVIGGFLLGVIISMVWHLSIFQTFFDAWWIDYLVALPIFFVGIYVLERQIGKISGIIEEELAKQGKANTKRSERT